MFDLHALLPFLLALVALQLSPGPDMLLVMGRGIGQGHRVAFLTALGATVLAGLVQVQLLAFGIVEHQRILAAITDRDPKLAEIMMRRHIAGARERRAGAMEILGETGAGTASKGG